MSVYKCSFRIYIIFYHRWPFNKTTATLVRPRPFSTLCTTPVGKMTLWEGPSRGLLRDYALRMELFEALISTVTTHCTVFTSGPTHDVAEGGKSLLHPLDADGVWERVPDLLQLLVRGGARHQQPVSVAHLEDRCGHGYDVDKKTRRQDIILFLLLCCSPSSSR